MATGILSEGAIAPPLRQVLRKHENVRVELADVSDIDLDRRRVTADRPPAPLDEYDSLIVATGGSSSYFGHDEYARVCSGLKTIDDALELRARIFGAFERLSSTRTPWRGEAWLTFAVVGGGPTGVEVAGQLAELACRSLTGDVRGIDPAAARVLLFDAGDALLARFGTKLSAVAERSMSRDGRGRSDARARDRGDPAAHHGQADGAQTIPTPRARLGGRRHGSPAGGDAGEGERSRDGPRAAASRSCPTSRCPGIPRSSRSAT